VIGSRRTGSPPAFGARRLQPDLFPHAPNLGARIGGNGGMPTTYHGPNQSPGGPKGPQANPGSFTPRVNPNSLLEQGGIGPDRNPLQHQDWWAAHGWQLNGGGDHFRRTPVTGNGQGNGHYPGHGGGQGNGNGQGHGGPGGHGNGPGGHGQPGMPLDPYYEAQRRMLEDQLQASLSPLRSAHDQVLASNGLQQARMDTNQGVDTDQLLNSMAARGIFGSGIQNHDQGQLSTDYLRQNQDLANATAGSLGDIASQRSAANLAYQQGLQEALLASAQRSNADKYAVAPIGGKGHGKRRTSKVRHETAGARRRRHG
jgi:hypothetical protein